MRPKLPEVYAAQDMEFPEDARIMSVGMRTNSANPPQGLPDRRDAGSPPG
jgi:hypothetical protein